jgi:hypothetical protein
MITSMPDTLAAIEKNSKVLESVNEAKMPKKYIGNDEIVFLKTKEDSRGAQYNLYYKGHDIEAGGARFGSEKELEDFAANYILSNQWYKKLRYEDSIPLPESIEEAKRSTVHKAAKKGSYPAVIVVVQDGKVIHQEPVSTPDIAPATFNVMQEKYPKALLNLEDNTGKRLFSEAVVTETNKISDDNLMKLIPKMPKGYVGKNTRIGEYTISTPDGEDIVLTQSKDKKNWFYEPSNVALKI